MSHHRRRPLPPSMAGPTTAHRPRFGFRTRGGPGGARSETGGRLGVDLLARPGAGAPDLDAALRDPDARPRLRFPAPWRRRSASMAVRRPSGSHAGRRKRLLSAPALTALVIAQALLIAVAAWLLTAPQWQVRYVQVQGTGDPVLVRAVAALPLAGCNIFRCDLQRDVRLVQGLPAVASATIHAQYPDTLIVEVTPRRPALLLRTDAGTVVVADDGVVLGEPASDPALAPSGLPDLADPAAALAGGRTPAPGARLDATAVKLAAQLRSGLKGALGDGWTLTYAAPEGFAAAGRDGSRVIFGTERNVAATVATGLDAHTLGDPPDPAAVQKGAQAQLAELRPLLAALAARQERATLIDLRWGAHPYVRLAGQ